MTNYVDSEAFEIFDRSPMTPCSPPELSDFSNNKTVIWANIDGQMRLYSIDGGIVKYQVVQLGTLTVA